MQQQMLQQSGAPVHPTYAQMLAQQQMIMGAAAHQMAQPMMAQPVMAQPMMAQPMIAQPILAQPVLQAQPAQAQAAQDEAAQAAHAYQPHATPMVATAQRKVPEPAGPPPTELPQHVQDAYGFKTPGSQDAHPIQEDDKEWSYGSSSNWNNWTNSEEKWDDQNWSDKGYGQCSWKSWKSWQSWNSWEESDNKVGDKTDDDSQCKEPEAHEPEPEECIQKFSVVLDQYTSNFPCPFNDKWVWIRMRRPPAAVSPHVVPAKRKVEMENWENHNNDTEDVKCDVE